MFLDSFVGPELFVTSPRRAADGCCRRQSGSAFCRSDVDEARRRDLPQPRSRRSRPQVRRRRPARGGSGRALRVARRARRRRRLDRVDADRARSWPRRSELERRRAGGEPLPLLRRPLRRQGQHRRRRPADHRGLPRVRLHAQLDAPVVARLRGRRRALPREDQPRPVRHRPRRRALALRDPAQPVRRALHPGRLELRLGGRGRGRARRASRSAPTRPARGACPAAFNNIVGLKPTRGVLSTTRRRPGLPLARLRLGLRAHRRGRRRSRRARRAAATSPIPTRDSTPAPFGSRRRPRRRDFASASRRARRSTSAAIAPAQSVFERALRAAGGLGRRARRRRLRPVSRGRRRSSTTARSWPSGSPPPAACWPRRRARSSRRFAASSRAPPASTRQPPSRPSTGCASSVAPPAARSPRVDFLLVPTTPTIYRIDEVEADPLRPQRDARHLRELRQPARPRGRGGADRISRRRTACRRHGDRPRGERRPPGRVRRPRPPRHQSNAGRDRAAPDPVDAAVVPGAGSHLDRGGRRPSVGRAAQPPADDAGGRFVRATRTAPSLSPLRAAQHDARQARPGRVDSDGVAIEIEVWALSPRGLRRPSSRACPPRSASAASRWRTGRASPGFSAKATRSPARPTSRASAAGAPTASR